MMYSQLSPSQSKAQHSMVLTTKSPLSSSPTSGGLLKVEQAWLLPWHRLESSHSPNWPPPAPTVKLLSPEWRLPLKPEYIKSNI